MSKKSELGGEALRAALICPDSEMAVGVISAGATLGQIEVVSRSDRYPAAGGLPESLVEKIDIALVDVGTDRAAGLKLVADLAAKAPQVAVVALHRHSDPEIILQCLRSGAAEFLPSPFAPNDLRQAAGRIRRRRNVEMRPVPLRRGRVHAFAPVKGGSGCTTLASNVAFRLAKKTNSSVLLADLHLSAGVIAFLLRLRSPYTVLDALRHSSQLDEALWKSLVVEHNGVDILAAPDRPEPALIEPYPVNEILDFARTAYEHVVVDLGSICDGVGLTATHGANSVNLVCSTEMTSLFLMRRTIPLLTEMGRSPDEFNVLVNRFDRRAELGVDELEKIFRASIHATFPEDSAAVLRAQREGVPVIAGSELGKALDQFVEGLTGAQAPAGDPGAFGALKQLLGRA